MARSEPGVDERVFGDPWTIEGRSPKPAWLQIEEQLADRIDSGALAAGEQFSRARHRGDRASFVVRVVRDELLARAR